MIFITGAGGQLGRHLQDQLLLSGYNFSSIERSKLDISNYKDVKEFFLNKNISILINAAAYTNVDKAEESIEEAFKVNKTGVENLIEICNQSNATLIHISTDYVFNGKSKKPYQPSDMCDPLGVYGKSKLAGETAVMKKANRFIIIRTSWVFSEHGRNFFKTIINLAKTRKELRVVADQYGNPTYAGDLAKAIVSLIPNILSDQNINHIYHYGGNQICSWYEFSSEICKEAVLCKIIPKMPDITPVKTSEFDTLAERPIFSGLDSSLLCKIINLSESDWKHAIKKILKDPI